MCGAEGGKATTKKRLYLEELAWVQYWPAAPQTELTDVVVTDISLLTLPHARPYEYLPSGEEPAVMQCFSTTDRVLSYPGWGMLVGFQSLA